MDRLSRSACSPARTADRPASSLAPAGYIPALYSPPLQRPDWLTAQPASGGISLLLTFTLGRSASLYLVLSVLSLVLADLPLRPIPSCLFLLTCSPLPIFLAYSLLPILSCLFFLTCLSYLSVSYSLLLVLSHLSYLSPYLSSDSSSLHFSTLFQLILPTVSYTHVFPTTSPFTQHRPTHTVRAGRGSG